MFTHLCAFFLYDSTIFLDSRDFINICEHTQHDQTSTNEVRFFFGHSFQFDFFRHSLPHTGFCGRDELTFSLSHGSFRHHLIVARSIAADKRIGRAILTKAEP